MDFRVYMIVDMPIIDRKYELLVPIDRKVNDLINILRKNIPELNEGYYKEHKPNLYNKITGELYNMNSTIKSCNIKVGTRVVLL